MAKFVVTENLVRYFVVEAVDEDSALDGVASRFSPHVYSQYIQPCYEDYVGYDIEDPSSVPFEVENVPVIEVQRWILG
jgi:hypothetical protein